MRTEKKIVSTNNSPAPGGPYSQAVIAGEFVFVSGQGPMNPKDRAITGDTIEIQTEMVINNIEALLVAAGSSLSRIVKCNIYLSDSKYFAGMNAVYRKMIPEPWPARTTVSCELRGILMEMEVVALLND